MRRFTGPHVPQVDGSISGLKVFCLLHFQLIQLQMLKEGSKNSDNISVLEEKVQLMLETLIFYYTLQTGTGPWKSCF